MQFFFNLGFWWEKDKEKENKQIKQTQKVENDYIIIP